MKKRKLLILAPALAISFALASCGGSEFRNTTTPYGSFNDKLSNEVATATIGDKNYSLDFKTYYDQLKYNSYSMLVDKIDALLYKNELNALNLMYTKDFDALNADELKLVKEVFELNDTNTEHGYTAQGKLYDLTKDKYDELKLELRGKVNEDISSQIFSNTSAEAIQKYTGVEYEKYINKFIDAQKLEGVYLVPSDIELIYPEDANYNLKKDSKIPQFAEKTINKLNPTIFAETMLSQAKLVKAKNALFEIADEEYIYDEELKDLTKNTSNYLFKDTSIKDSYNSSYKTFGTYNAIIIQFNSRREAMEAVSKVGEITKDNALDKYLELYKDYYKYKVSDTITTEDDEFKYEVSLDKNDFSDLTADITNLIQEVLEDGGFLSVPRNINNKYVMAYRIKTTYDNTQTAEQLDYSKMNDEQLKDATTKIKENIIKANANSYTSITYQETLKDSKIEIYDPYFEYRFQYLNSDNYDLVTTATSQTSSKLLSVNGNEYSVEEFYKEASDKFAYKIISDQFKLKYAYDLYDGYVKDYHISSTKHTDDEESLNNSINSFNKNENATYPNNIGLETFLLASYGYSNKEDVLKYAFDAKASLDTYISQYVFDEWSEKIETTDDGVTTTTYRINTDHVDSNAGIFANILNIGNAKYEELFGINLDHYLINIDDDANGTPDDPDVFLKGKSDEERAKFENAVIDLARALYIESINEKYKNSTKYEILKFIKTQYEEGKDLLEPYTSISGDIYTTWDDFKKYNLLLTVEQLASSGDITQASVSNFVVPFAEYVKNLYRTAKSNNDDDATTSGKTSTYKNGSFYLYDGTKGFEINKSSDADKIDLSTLCKTVFGYHVLILNSFTLPDETRYTKAEDDSKGYQERDIVLRKYSDSDENEITIYVTANPYNESLDKASINQLFIYYVQKETSTTSTLDSSLSSVLASLFDEAITKYTSSNFQDYLLTSKLNIAIKDSNINANVINNKLDNLRNLLLDYEIKGVYEDGQYLTTSTEESEYKFWFDKDTNWNRPNGK